MKKSMPSADPSSANTAAEVLIVPPTEDSDSVIATFVRRCVVDGIDFYFEDGDRIPSQPVAGLENLRAIFIDATRMDECRQLVDAYRAQGVAIYPMQLDSSAQEPNGTQSWLSPRVQHMSTVDAGLTVPSPDLRARLLARDEDVLFDQLVERLYQWQAGIWYDTTCYNWEMLLDISDVTGDSKYADAALSQMHRMMKEVENKLVNCDCIAPFRPMLRAAVDRQDHTIIDYVREHTDRYLTQTPRYRDCLVNFHTFPNTVRAEIIWQVLPSIALLGQVVEERSFTEVAHDQFTRIHHLLFDEQRGLWQHGIGPRGLTNVFWSRMVAFTLLGTLNLLEMTDENDALHPVLLDTYQRICANLPGLQREDGFFNSVVDNAVPSPESSGTAWITAGLIRSKRLGYIGEEYDAVCERAWQATLTRVWDGDFPGHMTATTVSRVPGYYHRMGLSDTGWPQFPLRAMCEKRRTKQVAAACSA